MRARAFYWICGILFGTNILLGGVIYFKTNLVQRIGVRIGLIESKPMDNPNYWCIQGWTNTLEKMDMEFDAVFFGNSITRGSSFHKTFPNVRICNLGFPGDNLDGMMLRVNQIKAVNPKKVFIMAGINGLNLQPINVFENKYEKLVKAVCDSVPNATIYLQSILPVNNDIAQKFVCNNDKIIEANQIINRLSEKHHCIYIDLFSIYEKDGEMNPELTRDGVHLYEESYNMWAKVLQQYLTENIAQIVF